MCFRARTKEEQTKYYAAYDMVVYKICINSDNGLLSLFYSYPYKLGQLNKPIQLQPIIRKGADWFSIEQGYHSFKKFLKKEPALNSISYCYFKKQMILIGIREVIVEFIIPKGTAYYENNDGEIVSENIICTGNIID